MSHKHITSLIGDGFYESNDSTNSVKALKKDRDLRIRLQLVLEKECTLETAGR